MPGILELYVTHANDFISGHVAASTVFKISRADFELTLMRELDRFSFPIEYKLAWFDAILNSDHSTSFWLSVQLQHSLPPSCIARYVLDSSLLTYDAPPSARPRSPLASTMRSISPPTTPTPTSRTNKGNKAWTTGGTEPIHPDDIIKEVWYDEVDPRMVKHEKFPAAGQHIAKAAPKSKARAAAKPIPKAAPKSKAKAAPKATEHGAGEAKPKRKRASGAGGARVKKTKKGESGEV